MDHLRAVDPSFDTLTEYRLRRHMLARWPTTERSTYYVDFLNAVADVIEDEVRDR